MSEIILPINELALFLNFTSNLTMDAVLLRLIWQWQSGGRSRQEGKCTFVLDGSVGFSLGPSKGRISFLRILKPAMRPYTFRRFSRDCTTSSSYWLIICSCIALGWPFRPAIASRSPKGRTFGAFYTPLNHQARVLCAARCSYRLCMTVTENCNNDKPRTILSYQARVAISWVTVWPCNWDP